MNIALSVKSVPRRLAFVALALTAAAAYGQQQPSQEKETNSLDAVLLASAAPAPPKVEVTAPALPAPPPPPSSGFNWTGFYVGVNIGWGSGSADTFVNPLPTAAQFINLKPQTLSPDPSGIMGGGQVGFNWQHGHFVLGAEFDMSASGMDGTKTVTPIIQNNGTPFPGAGFVSAHQDTDWVASLRPRLGVTLVPRLLVYGTGGVAWAHVTDFAITDFRPVGTTRYPAFIDDTKTGWIAGGGAEIGLSRRWSVRGEFLHYNVGTDSRTVNAIPLLPPFQVAYTIGDTTANTFNFGLNFRF
ncbi:MAG TPA: outer membrane protein [Candidatus Angelobacter sp.]|nr:outer membrane protein [Candidatus Angelobacter sp.]